MTELPPTTSSTATNPHEPNWGTMTVSTRILALLIPLPLLCFPAYQGTSPLWQLAVCYFVLATTILIGSQLGAWLFARQLPVKQRLIRRLPYAIGVLSLVVWKMHSTFGCVGSIPIAIAAIPGLTAILFDAAAPPQPDQ